MKRLAAALLAISLVLGLPACSSPAPEPPEFTDGAREWDEAYPAHIETKSAEFGGLGVHFSASAFDAAASPELAQKAAEDYAALSGAGEADIYILNEPLTDAPFVSGAELFCTAEAVESGEYRPALVSAALGITGRWQAEGLSRELFGAEVPDGLADEVAAYLAAHEGSNLLSLAPFYFTVDFADAETIALASGCAQSLAAYVIGEAGQEALRGSCSEYLPGWLDHLGLEAETEGLQTLMELDYTQELYYPAEFTRSVFTFRPVPTEWIPDADAASAYVLRLCTGLDWLLDYLETNAPESWARIAQTKPYEVRFEDSPDASCADVYSSVVHLRAPSAGLHELAHALTIDELCGEAGWVFEGVAMHCTEWWISYEDYEVFFDLAEDIDTMEGASEDERFIFGEIRRIFKELSGVDVSEAQALESPAILLVKAMTCALLLHPERDVFIKMVSKPTGDVVSSFYEPKYPSTVLSHAKSYAFCEYLLEQGCLTLDELVSASLDLEGYRAAFPTDEYFDALYTGYLDWLREEFCP